MGLLGSSVSGKQLLPAAGDPHLADYFRWSFFAAGPFEQAISHHSFNIDMLEGSSQSPALAPMRARSIHWSWP